MHSKNILFVLFSLFSFTAISQELENTTFKISGDEPTAVKFTQDAEGLYKIIALGDGWIGFSNGNMEYRSETPFFQEFVKDSVSWYRTNKYEMIMVGRADIDVNFPLESYLYSILAQKGIKYKASDLNYYQDNFGIVLLGTFDLPEPPYELVLKVIEKDQFERFVSADEFEINDNIISYKLEENKYYEMIFTLDSENIKKQKCSEKTIYVSTVGIPEEVLPTGIIPQVEINFTGKSKKCSVEFEWNDNLYTLTYKII